ncbi:hypothetical protein CP533_2287 [Ophiocordyceps camponoti-saundersi (nom. inval.)]|nr:hypothetical protein CP533_2287 [Ophiocordyceps camponoti-saundersi (nom. inval.)]
MTQAQQLPNASSVTTVNLGRLAARDDGEMEKLRKAASYPGYFYLDLGDVAEQTRRIYAVADRYFDQPAEVKMRDAREGQPASSDRGFKSCVTDESFEMSTDEMRQGTLHLPAAISEQEAAVNSFHERCHSATMVVLERLADALSMPLTQHHDGDAEQTSESGLKLIAEPAVARAADVVENKHRDSGTLTMLFYDAWSLHICLSGEGEETQRWTFVPPPPDGCALVHGASTLCRMTDGKLCAPLHRVTQPGDGAAKRFFLSYFLRPDHRMSLAGPVCAA